MMERVKVREWVDTLLEQLRTENARRALTAMGSFLAGMVCSRGLMFGKYAPFGVAVAAASSSSHSKVRSVYLPGRYAAALVAVTAIRWALSELKSVNTHPLFAPAAAFLPLLLTGMTMVFLNGSISYTAALYVAESFLGAGSAYFLRPRALLGQGGGL